MGCNCSWLVAAEAAIIQAPQAEKKRVRKETRVFRLRRRHNRAKNAKMKNTWVKPCIPVEELNCEGVATKDTTVWAKYLRKHIDRGYNDPEETVEVQKSRIMELNVLASHSGHRPEINWATFLRTMTALNKNTAGGRGFLLFRACF